MNRKSWWQDVLKKYDRIAVVGGPRAGKTTLTRIADREVIHTDDHRKHTWEAVPYFVIGDALDCTSGRFIVEGVQVARALRKGLGVDVVCVLNEPLQELTPRQEGMRKGVMTVLAEWWAAEKQKERPTVLLQAPPVTDLDKDEPEE